MRQLTSFYHVARLGSVFKAARTLRLGQLTVTSHVLKLEEEFSITLFDSIRRPVKLTSDGSDFLKFVTLVLTSIDALKTQMEFAGRRGSIVVGAYRNLVTHHLPIGIQKFRDVYTDVRIRLLARSYNPLVQLVRSGEIDLAFCSEPPGDDIALEFRNLFEYMPVVVIPSGHILVGRQTNSLANLASCPLILPGTDSLLRNRVDEAFKSQGLVPDVVLALDDFESMKRYVEIGMGVAIGNDFTLHTDDHARFGIISLEHLFPTSVIGVCTLRASSPARQSGISSKWCQIISGSVPIFVYQRRNLRRGPLISFKGN